MVTLYPLPDIGESQRRIKRGFMAGGGTGAVKKPGHFEVRKSSSQIIRMHFVPQKKVDDLF